MRNWLIKECTFINLVSLSNTFFLLEVYPERSPCTIRDLCFVIVQIFFIVRSFVTRFVVTDGVKSSRNMKSSELKSISLAAAAVVVVVTINLIHPHGVEIIQVHATEFAR